jgi:nitroreductase
MNSPVIDHLLSRVSPPVHELQEPGPNEEELRTMLAAASRVPDHGRLEPWRFILYRRKARDRVGELLADLAERREGPLSEGRRRQELSRFNRAPLVVGVVSVPKESPKIPQWEMFLSGAAAAMNLVHAAHALGFKANWISNWYSDVPEGRAILGLQPHERVVGFVHIGSHDGPVADRTRPDADAIASDWSGPAAT